MRFILFSFLIHAGFGLCIGQVPLFQNQSKTHPKLSEGVSLQVRRILGGEGGASPSERIQEARRISIFSEQDVEAILSYLETKTPRSPGVFQNSQLEHQLRNTLMNRLHQSAVDPDRLAECFSEIIADQAMDPVLRDYAAQHLGNLVEKEDCSATLRNRIHEQLFGLMNSEGDSSVAGTAALALAWNWRDSLSDQEGRIRSFPTSRLIRSCEALAKNDNALVGNRAAAVAVAGEIFATDELPIQDWIVELLSMFEPGGAEVENREAKGPVGADRRAEEGRIGGEASLLLACAHAIVQSGEPESSRRLEKLIQALRNDSENKNSVFLSNALNRIAESKVDNAEMKSVLP